MSGLKKLLKNWNGLTRTVFLFIIIMNYERADSFHPVEFFNGSYSLLSEHRLYSGLDW